MFACVSCSTTLVGSWLQAEGMAVDEFAGKAAIITGASRGIGRAVAIMIAGRGASVVLVGRDHAALAETQHAIAATGQASQIVTGELRDPKTAARACETALAAFGRVDVLANIAGAYPTALLCDTTDTLVTETIEANLVGTINMCRAVLPLMIVQGEGAVVNMSSTAARFPTPGLSVYAASKAGVEAFTRAVAAEYAPHVRVNAVSAGPTMTDAVAALIGSDETGAVSAVTSALPLQRLGTPDEIAEAVLFLASPRSSFITGQILHANGGGLMA